MKCPVCNAEMVIENFGIEVYVCENGCKGIWFDQGELRKLDAKNEGLGSALEAALRYPRNNHGQRGQINCPRCSIPMHTHKYDKAKEVNVDECYNCGGFFLDSGELTEIRDNRMSDAEIDAYTDQMANSIPEYKQELKDIDAEKRRAEDIRGFIKMMTTGYWRRRF
jgi:Zn-finger nucleic acid-binding protein